VDAEERCVVELMHEGSGPQAPVHLDEPGGPAAISIHVRATCRVLRCGRDRAVHSDVDAKGTRHHSNAPPETPFLSLPPLTRGGVGRSREPGGQQRWSRRRC
jgi:hypothetical protein